MSHEESVLALASLVLEAAALSEALLDGDLEEARFRAELVAGLAHTQGLPAIQRAALAVVNRLGNAGDPPRNGYAKAVQDLSVELDGTMARLRR
jgi:hypothetical protein